MQKFLLPAIVLASIYLSLVHLDHTAFWDDEAEVAIMGRSILQHGQPMGWDGRNLFAYHNGELLDANGRDINPPLQHYLAATSFRFLGVSTLTGRLPFALLGLAALFVFVLLVRSELNTKDAQIYAVALCGLSVVFLMNIRECRYYSPAMLGALLTYYGYRRLLAGGNWSCVLLAGCGLVTLFFASYLLCAAFVGGLLLTTLLHHRTLFTANFRWKLLTIAAVGAAATLPYAVRYHIWHRPDIHPDLSWPMRTLYYFWTYYRDINHAVYFPWLLLLIPLYWLCRKKGLGHPLLKELITLQFGYVVALAMLTPLPAQLSDYAPIRYLTALSPFLALALALIIHSVHERKPALAIILTLVTLCTNLFNLAPNNRVFRWTLPALIAELHRPYPTACSTALDYLSQHATRDETIIAAPEYMNYPLMFYAGDRYLFRGLLDSKSHLRPQSQWPPSLWRENVFPSRLIAFGMHGECKLQLIYYSRTHREGNRWIYYPYEIEALLPVFCEQTQRPEFYSHTFGPLPIHEGNKYEEAVYIFRRGKAVEVTGP